MVEKQQLIYMRMFVFFSNGIGINAWHVLSHLILTITKYIYYSFDFHLQIIKQTLKKQIIRSKNSIG